MSIAPDLFRSVVPPAVWIALAEVDHPESDTRKVVLRVKPSMRRSISITEEVSRYAPEWSILRGLAHAIQILEGAQGTITRQTMQAAVREGLHHHVEPF